jgi:hypothetical protein
VTLRLSDFIAFRVAYRGYLVLSKPVEDLVVLLGLEVPVAPIVSLAGIKADGVLLHWKPPDPRASVLKYVIRINGIDSVFATFPHTDTAHSHSHFHSWRCFPTRNLHHY